MATIDIRQFNEDEEIDTIVFAKEAGDCDRADTVYKLTVDFTRNYHNEVIFISGDEENGDYIAVRRKDVGNLIRALKHAQEIWEDCK